MDLKKILRPYMRRLRFETFMQACFSAFSAGFAVAMLFTTITRIFAFDFHYFLIVGATVAGAIAAGVVAYIKVFRKSYQVFLRRIDQAGLQDRLITMAQFMKDDSFIAKKQRADTIATLKKLRPTSVPFHMPLITATIALSLVVVNIFMALWPALETPVTPDLPLTDLYTESNPIIEDLVGDLKDQYDKLPDSEIKDQIKDIIDNIENILGSNNKTNSDNISDLEEELEKVEEMIKDNQVSKTFGQILAEFPATRELGLAIYARNQEKINQALENLRPDLFEMVYEVLVVVENSNADQLTKDDLTLRLGDLIVEMTAIKDGDSTGKLNGYLNAIRTTREVLDTLDLTPTGDIADLFESTEDFATLGQALNNGELAPTLNALDAIWATLNELDLAALDSKLDEYIAILTDIKGMTSTNSQDSLYLALEGYIEGLQNIKMRVYLEFTLKECREEIALSRDSVSTLFMDAVGQRSENENLRQLVVMELDNILSRDQEKAIFDEFRSDFAKALDLAGFSIYTPLPLVMALVNLSDGLGNSTAILLENRDYSSPLKTSIETAKIEIWMAILGEVEKEEILEDVKDKIEDAIEDILKENENQDIIAPDQNENQNQNQNPEENQQPSDKPSDEQNQNQNQNNNNSSSNPGGQDNLEGLTFYNPMTGQNEVLTQENLNSFKEAMDTAIENETYTSEQQDAMERYYELISQKFEKNN